MRQADESSDEEFRSFGRFDPFEAERLLSRFQETGIRFQVDPESIIAPNRGWTRFYRYNFVEIFVHQEDEERARRILGEKLRLKD
jgi:hypothetical protein